MAVYVFDVGVGVPSHLVLQSWLCDVEKMMRVTLKNLLRACRIDLKKHLSKRDKWVKEWPGQVSTAGVDGCQFVYTCGVYVH